MNWSSFPWTADCPIIEDGAYRDLYFEDDAPLPSLKALDETGMVITLGSASKSLAPGLQHRMAGSPPNRSCSGSPT